MHYYEKKRVDIFNWKKNYFNRFRKFHGKKSSDEIGKFSTDTIYHFKDVQVILFLN